MTRDGLFRRGCHGSVSEGDTAVLPRHNVRTLQKLGRQVALPHIRDERVVVVVARPTLILDDIGVAEDRIRIPSVAAGVVDEPNDPGTFSSLAQCDHWL